MKTKTYLGFLVPTMVLAMSLSGCAPSGDTGGGEEAPVEAPAGRPAAVSPG